MNGGSARANSSYQIICWMSLRPRPAVLGGPVDAGPAAVEQGALPGEVELAACRLPVGRPLLGREVLGEPGAGLVAERLLVGGEVEIHEKRLTHFVARLRAGQSRRLTSMQPLTGPPPAATAATRAVASRPVARRPSPRAECRPHGGSGIRAAGRRRAVLRRCSAEVRRRARSARRRRRDGAGLRRAAEAERLEPLHSVRSVKPSYSSGDVDVGRREVGLAPHVGAGVVGAILVKSARWSQVRRCRRARRRSPRPHGGFGRSGAMRRRGATRSRSTPSIGTSQS